MFDDVDLADTLRALELNPAIPMILPVSRFVRLIAERRGGDGQPRERPGGRAWSTSASIERVAAQRGPRPTGRWQTR